jgi:PIN domain nuclease of toxin-antitoxin system
MHHKDPFDRMLVAQALVERFGFVTRDAVIARYGIPTIC